MTMNKLIIMIVGAAVISASAMKESSSNQLAELSNDSAVLAQCEGKNCAAPQEAAEVDRRRRHRRHSRFRRSSRHRRHRRSSRGYKSSS